jgi:prepilin-type N-terminal cleavage/methylation domain-containing protein
MTMRYREGRSGFTLLEVLLATAIGVLLLAALYVALNVQLHHVQSGRDAAEQGLLVRSLLTRMGNDISASLGPVPPKRTTSSSSSSSTNGSSTSSSSTSTTNSSTSSTTTPATTDTSSNSSTTTNSLTGPVQFNLGVQGDTTRLVLFVSRVPREVSFAAADPSNPNSQLVVSDLRRITYWLAGGDPPLGLARQEIKPVTADEATGSLTPDVDEEAAQVIAEEVKSLEFSYFDGTSWQSSWDGTAAGSDGSTPRGPPLAIAIKVGIRPTGSKSEELTYYRHVVALPTANGATSVSGTTGQ